MTKKDIYGSGLMFLAKVFGKDRAKTWDAKLRFGKKLNLKSPSTLADKVTYIENHCPSPLAASCTDKWQVRDYVKSKGLGEILVPVHGDCYSRFEEIPFEEFPERFVLKATHGCKMNYFCESKKNLDLADCKKKVNRWLRTTYGRYSCEWHYLEIPHRVYCEEYLEDAASMIDYKFHCMNGRPEFVQVISEREASEYGMKMKQNLYDMEWKALEGLTQDQGKVSEKPAHFQEMVEIARKLAEDFNYVRVDLYEIKDKIYFSELTFTPANGVFPNFTEQFLEEMGVKLLLLY